MERDGQGAGFEPQIQMIQAARLDGHDDVVLAGVGCGKIAPLEAARSPVSDQLERFHLRNRRVSRSMVSRAAGILAYQAIA